MDSRLETIEKLHGILMEKDAKIAELEGENVKLLQEVTLEKMERLEILSSKRKGGVLCNATIFQERFAKGGYIDNPPIDAQI